MGKIFWNLFGIVFGIIFIFEGISESNTIEIVIGIVFIIIGIVPFLNKRFSN